MKGLHRIRKTTNYIIVTVIIVNKLSLIFQGSRPILDRLKMYGSRRKIRSLKVVLVKTYLDQVDLEYLLTPVWRWYK